MISDAAGNVLFFNRRWYEFTGMRYPGEPWESFIHPDDAARVASDWRAGVECGQFVIEMDYRLRRAESNEYRWFTSRAIALTDGERITGWMGIAIDVDDRKTSEHRLTQLYRQERLVADRFQQASLPSGFPNERGLTFDAACVPSTQQMVVGGDWYDAFELKDGSVAVAVGDVGGHGLEAALVMSKLRQSIRALAYSAGTACEFSPSGVLDCAEVTIGHEYPEAMATVFLGLIDPQSRRLVYASAGHPAGFCRYRSGRLRDLPATGTPLGWRFDGARTDGGIDLAGAQFLFLYTDGLIEAQRDLLGSEYSLRRFLSDRSDPKIGGICRAVIDHMIAGEVRDDVAALAICFDGV